MYFVQDHFQQFISENNFILFFHKLNLKIQIFLLIDFSSKINF